MPFWKLPDRIVVGKQCLLTSRSTGWWRSFDVIDSNEFATERPQRSLVKGTPQWGSLREALSYEFPFDEKCEIHNLNFFKIQLDSELGMNFKIVAKQQSSL